LGLGPGPTTLLQYTCGVLRSLIRTLEGRKSGSRRSSNICEIRGIGWFLQTLAAISRDFITKPGGATIGTVIEPSVLLPAAFEPSVLLPAAFELLLPLPLYRSSVLSHAAGITQSKSGSPVAQISSSKSGPPVAQISSTKHWPPMVQNPLSIIGPKTGAQLQLKFKLTNWPLGLTIHVHNSSCENPFMDSELADTTWLLSCS
jgi:hypothetical protein